MNPTELTLERGVHQGASVIFIRFEFNRDLINHIKSLGGMRWSSTHKAWHTPYSEERMNDLISRLGEVRMVRVIPEAEGRKPEKLPEDRALKVEAYISWMRSKLLSDSTIRTYGAAITVFLQFFRDKKVEEIDHLDVIRFNNEYLLKGKKSSSYQNQMVNAIKKFFSMIENREMNPDLVHRPKAGHPLPHILSKEEVRLMLESIRNLKHRTMLSLIYSCGLRRGELIALKPGHLHFDRKILEIRGGKGKKDRIVPLGDRIITLLQEYLRMYKPETYLFEGQVRGQCYGDRSLQLVMKQSLKRAGLDETATLHWLRHSYATHLHESGTDIRYIQILLGHNSSRTTEIYTHVSRRSIENIRSPFDDL